MKAARADAGFGDPLANHGMHILAGAAGLIELMGFGQRLGCSLQINRILASNVSRDQVQPTGPLILALKRTITNFPETVKEDGSR